MIASAWPDHAAPETDSSPVPHVLRVQVYDAADGRSKMLVAIPIGLVDVGVKMGARFLPESAEVDITQLAESLKAGVSGELIKVYDSTHNEWVQISME